MTKTLTQHLQAIKDSKRGIFVPYIMAGDHEKGLDGLFETIQLLEESGASAIGGGIPWSDPVADGPVIEMAGQRSLAKGVTLTAIVKKTPRTRDQDSSGHHDLYQSSLPIWYRGFYKRIGFYLRQRLDHSRLAK